MSDNVGLKERAARAVYAQMPNFGLQWVANTEGGYSQRRVDDAWEEAPDRHDECRRIAQAVIKEIRALSPSLKEQEEGN